MIKNFFILILLLFLISCNQRIETNITLYSNSPTWTTYKGFYFEKELIICGAESAAQIKLTKKLNDNDTIYNGVDNSNNRFMYATTSNETGHFVITGKVFIDNKEVEFSQDIIVKNPTQPVGFNTKNAFDLKVGIENEIQIALGIPKKYRTLKTDNGEIIEREEKTIVIPKHTGKCEIEIDVNLPYGEILEYKNVLFNVK